MSGTSQKAVALLSPPDGGRGTAFAISDRLALTAFHCVARNGDGETIDRAGRKRTIDEVELRFKPARPPLDDGDEAARATVVDGDSVRDWALLELEQPLSDRWDPILISDSEMAEGESFTVHGYPGRVQKELNGPFIAAVDVRGHSVRNDAPVVQLFTPDVGLGVNPQGMSGGPVLTRDGREAVGLFIGRLLQAGGQVGGAVYACAADAFSGIGAEDWSDPPGPVPAGVKPELLAEARRGGAEAARRIGILAHAAGDVEGGEKWFRYAATGGDPAAAYFVGIAMDPEGKLIEQNEQAATEALKWFRKAATGGDVYGMNTMGIRLHQHALHRKEDSAAAIPWLEEAVDRGTDAMAAHTLGCIWAARGDKTRAEEYERLAAEQEDPAAAYELACLLLKRNQRDDAIRWLRVAKADSRAAERLNELGVQ
jgi:hypothetical protein